MNEPYVTNRKMVKIMLLSMVTCGIYWVVTMMNIRKDLNKFAPELPSTGSYIPVFLVPTCGIWPIVWMHKMSNKVGYALKQRGLNYSFSSREFWLWYFLGSALSGAGPWVYTWRLCSAMNLLSEYENCKMSGTTSPLVDKYLGVAQTAAPAGAGQANFTAVNANAAVAGGAVAGAAVAGATYAAPQDPYAAPNAQAAGAQNAGTQNAGAQAASNTESKIDIGAGFKAFGQFLLASFKKPLSAAEEFFENAKLGDSIVTLGAVVVLYTAISFITGIISVVYSAVRYGHAYNGVGKIVGGLFFPILYCAIMGAACFGLYCAINALFIKKPKNFTKLAAYGAACGVGLLLDSAITFFSRTLGILGVPSGFRVVFWVAETVLGCMVLVIGLVNLKKVIEDERKYVAAVGIAMSGLTVASFILYWMFRLADWNFFTIPM